MSSDITEFSVIFYKRSLHSKVHKSKGVSKIDGVLTVHLSNKTVSLRCADDEDSSEDEDQKMTWKERRKKSTKSAPKGVVYSGKLPSGEVSHIQTDSTIILGSYEVEIVAATSNSVATVPSGNPQPVMAMKKTTIAALRPSLSSKKTTLPVKRRLVTQSFSQSSALLKRRPPPQPQNVLPVKKLTQHPAAKRPANVLRKVDNTTKQEKEDTTTGMGTTGRTTIPSTSIKPTMRPKISTFRPPTVMAAGPTVLPHIPLPGSIRNALRPHQREGVDFIWRALSEHKGCLLADEMGL